MSIELKPIVGEHTRACPCCSAPLMQVTTQTEKLVTGSTWLTDGDTIFGLYGKLVEAGLEKVVETNDDWYRQHYDFMLWVGSCPSCDQEFCVIEVSMVDDRVAVEPWFVDAYFHLNQKIPDPSFCLASQADEQWLVTRHETDLGICLVHSFGPFKVEDETLIGPNGVSLCSGGSTTSDHAASFLFEKWPSLKALARTVNEEF